MTPLPEHSFRRLINWGPIVALTLIFYISIVAVYAQNIWWPLSTSSSLCHALAFLSSVALILYHFLRACYVGPGQLPLGWAPRRNQDRSCLQFCEECRGYKAPRVHHCRVCNRCVKKMDHHCPWIGNCVGHDNQANFILFLLFVVIGCTHATSMLGVSVFKILFWTWTTTSGVLPCRQLKEANPDRELFGYRASPGGEVVCSWSPDPDASAIQIASAVFAAVFALALVIAIFFMLASELHAASRNRTGIEDWIEEKAEHRRAHILKLRLKGEPKPFVYPYDLGWRENLKQVFLRTSEYGVRGKLLDGITWPTVSGCSPYALTVEQLQQKAEKKKNASGYVVKKAYSGKCCAVGYDWSVRCTPYCSTDEVRLELAVGERVKVTRITGNWMYGWREPPRLLDLQEKGWFPRAAVKEIPARKNR